MQKDKLDPNDFPVKAAGKKLYTADGKPIATVEHPKIAEAIAEVLNEDDERNEIDKWSA